MLNIYWLRNELSLENEPQLWPLKLSVSHKLTESRATRYPYGTYLQMLTENLLEKKVIIKS